jgi:hypothetical protein
MSTITRNKAVRNWPFFVRDIWADCKELGDYSGVPDVDLQTCRSDASEIVLLGNARTKHRFCYDLR